MWERRPLFGVLIGLTLCVSIWRISSQEPQLITEYQPYMNPSGNETMTYPPPISLDQLPSNDLANLIDLDNFEFIINQRPCGNASMSGSVPPHTLILIHSAPSNWNKRTVIRETWGQEDPRSRIIFLLGAVNSTDLQRRIEHENNLFQDIVQGNFYDAYRNMTYKHIMALKWFSYYCPDARYLVKTDDDVFVHTPNLYDFLDYSAIDKRNMLFCSKLDYGRVSRSFRSKWRVKIKEYPDRYYPPYCPGFTIIYSPDIAFTLYKEAQRTKYFWIDDVHVTGTLAVATGTTITSFVNYYLKSAKLRRLLKGDESVASTFFIFTLPNLTEKDIRTLWNVVSSSSLSSSSSSSSTTSSLSFHTNR